MRNVKLRTPLSSLFVLLLMSALAQAQTASSLPDLQSADALGADLFLQSGATGLVLVVVRDNQVFFRGYGETAPNSHQLPTQDSLLRLCSLTKIFTTDVLTRLVLDKTVRLADSLQRFAPPHTVVPRRTGPITLADLATHTSGLPRELANAPRDTPHFTFPDYLSDVLQSATHRQYAALLAERTLNPLHMRNTTFFPSAAQCSHLLMGISDEGACTATEATAGSSGLYSTATDMAIWLQYLLRTGSPSTPAQSPVAQNIYILPSKLVGQKGLDHAGEPTGIGLGWIHILPADDPSHIIEKTGGGAGYETYIAINHSRRTAIFLAATDGSADTHLNLFNAANKLLLAVAGLPPLPPPPRKPAVRHPRRSHHR